MSLTPKRLTIGILLVALLVRMTAAVYWQSKAESEGVNFRLGDSHSYWTLASHIAQFEPYEYGSSDAQVFRAPLFPIFLAPFTAFADESQGVLAARFACCLLGTLAVGLLMLATARWFGTCAALAGGVLAAFHPGAIGMSITILSEAIFIPLAMWNLICLANALRSSQNPSAWRAASLAGFAAGLAVLARPSWILFLPFTAAIGLLFGPDRKRQVVMAMLAGLTFAFTMTPWWIRNTLVVGQFVPSTLQVGLSLYDGLHEGATGASDEGMQFSQEFQRAQRVADRQTSAPLKGSFEFRVDQRARQAALKWASDNPTQVARLAMSKFLKTWSLWPDGGQQGSTAIRLGISLGTFTILLAALLGTCCVWRNASFFLTFACPATHGTENLAQVRWAALLCWLPCLYFTAIHMVFIGSVRYREPGVFVLCALAGVGAAWLAGCYRTSPRPVSLRLGQGSHSARPETS